MATKIEGNVEKSRDRWNLSEIVNFVDSTKRLNAEEFFSVISSRATTPSTKDTSVHGSIFGGKLRQCLPVTILTSHSETKK